MSLPGWYCRGSHSVVGVVHNVVFNLWAVGPSVDADVRVSATSSGFGIVVVGLNRQSGYGSLSCSSIIIAHPRQKVARVVPVGFEGAVVCPAEIGQGA